MIRNVKVLWEWTRTQRRGDIRAIIYPGRKSFSPTRFGSNWIWAKNTDLKLSCFLFLYELFLSVSFSDSVSLLESFLKLKRCLLINIFSLYTTLNIETNLDSIEGGALALNCRSWIDIGWRSVPVLQSPIYLLHFCFVYWLWSICESVRICTLKTN